MVAILIPQVSLMIFIKGDKQLVVQEAFEIISDVIFNSGSFTPKTKMGILESFGGAERITFFAPA
jgi:hypothetical protein